MTWQPIPSVNEPHYLDTNLNQIQKCVNWYHEKTPSGLVLMSLHGFQLKGTVANGQPGRGAKYDTESGKLFSVHGDAVYQIHSDGTSTALTGSLFTTQLPVVFASGLSQIMLVDGLKGYIIDPSANTVTLITDSLFPLKPVSCACFNGQFIVVDGGTDRWYMSAVDNGLVWTPTISGRAIANGDALMHVEVVRDTVLLFGQYSIEQWYAASVDPFLQPITGSVHPVGIVNLQTVSRIDDALFFYGLSEKSRGSFWSLMNGQLNRIATPYIEDKIGDWSVGSPYYSRSFAYSNSGRRFFEIYNDSTSNYPGWLYSSDTDLWSEVTPNRTLFTVVNAFTDGTPPIGFDYVNGNVYWLGTTAQPKSAFYGSSVIRTLDFKVDGGMSRTSNPGLRFEFEGIADSASTYTLSATLTKSDDGGLTFGGGVTLSRTVTSGTSAQQIILSSPPLGSYKAGRIYRLVIASGGARLILRRAEGLVRVGRF